MVIGAGERSTYGLNDADFTFLNGMIPAPDGGAGEVENWEAMEWFPPHRFFRNDGIVGGEQTFTYHHMGRSLVDRTGCINIGIGSRTSAADGCTAPFGMEVPEFGSNPWYVYVFHCALLTFLPSDHCLAGLWLGDFPRDWGLYACSA